MEHFQFQDHAYELVDVIGRKASTSYSKRYFLYSRLVRVDFVIECVSLLVAYYK